MALAVAVLAAAALAGTAEAAGTTSGNFRVRYGTPEARTALTAPPSLSSSLFTIRDAVRIDFVANATDGAVLDNSTLTWSVPAACFDAPGADSSAEIEVVGPTVVLRCSQPGDYAVSLASSLLPALSDTFFITYSDVPACYRWYVAVVASRRASGDNGFDVQLRVWAIDPLLASPDELAGNATLPSVASGQISRQYFQLGDFPDVIGAGSFEATLADPLQFSETGRYWEGAIRVETPVFPLFVFGRGVSVLTCVIRDTTFILAFERMPGIADAGEPADVVAADMADRPLRIGLDPCALAFAAVVATNASAILVSQDGVLSSTAFSFDEQVLDALPVGDESMLIVTESQVLLSSDMESFAVVEGLSGIDRAGRALACDFLESGDGSQAAVNARIVVWATNNPSAFHFVAPDGSSFSSVAIESPVDTLTAVSVLEIAVQVSQPFVAVLLMVQDSSDGSEFPMIWLYDTRRLIWLVGQEFRADTAPLVTGQTALRAPSMKASSSGAGTAFVWGDRFYYSPDGGLTAEPFALLSRDPARPAVGLAPTEFVVDVASNAFDLGFVVLTSTNRLFYSRSGLQFAQELQSGQSPLAAVRPWFDAVGQLYMVSVTEADGLVAQPIPVANEVFAPKVPAESNRNDVCPYLSWTDDAQSVYYIDVGESFQISQEFVPLPGSSNQLSVSVSDTTIVDFTTSSEEFLSSSIIGRRETVTVTERVAQRQDNSPETVELLQGETDIRRAPLSATAQCESVERISRVRVGCPPGRRIRIRDFEQPSADRANDDCRRFANGDATLRFRNNDTEGVYPYDRLGCPVRVFYSDSGYRPAVELLDGDEVVEEVDANFIVFEITGRTGYGFNATEGDAKCLRHAQTYAEFEEQGLEWTAQTFQSCHELGPDDMPRTGNNRYEVLNSTGLNAIKFTRQDGIFVFRLRVVDLHYSYCELETEFALDVYGAPLNPLTFLIVVGVFTVVASVLLTISYYAYKKQKVA